jgi:hypothetical protein
LVEQELDLTQDQRVALHRSRVVGLLVPDVFPDAPSLGWERQATYVRQAFNSGIKALVDSCSGRTSSHG